MLSKNLYLYDLRNSFSKRYTLDEYLKMVRTKDESYLIKEQMKEFGINEEIASMLVKDSRVKKLAGFLLGFTLFAQKNLAYAATPTVKGLDKIDTAGWTLIAVLRKIGYFVLLIMCIIEVLRSVANGDTKEIGKIIMKYLMAFAVLFLLPWLFDIIVGIFG